MTARPPVFDRIHAILRRARRRLRARIGLSTLGWIVALAGLVALVTALVFSAVRMGGAAGPVFWSLVALTAIAAAVVAGGRPLWRTRPDEAVAEHLEGHVDDLHDGLLACVQYAREWPDTGRGDPRMAAALAERIATRLESADLRAATPMRPAGRSWIMAGVTGLAWLVCALAFGDALSRGLRSLTPVSATGELRETGPLVGDLDLVLHFPAYTGRTPRRIPNSTGELAVPKGTRIELRATTLEPAQAVTLMLGEAELPLALVEGRDVSGAFVVESAIDWRFSVVDPLGERWAESVQRRLRIEVDQPPQVTLKLPAEDLELEDLRAVPVVYDARDDFGLSAASVVIALASEQGHPEKIEQPGVRGLRIDGRDEVDLSVVQAQPGDRLALMVEAYDNNDVDGPQRGVSGVRYITVHSPQAAHYALTEKLRGTVEVLLDALADRLEMGWGAAESPLPRRIADVMLATDEARRALGGVVDEMVEDPLTPNEVRLALTGRLEGLRRTADEEREVVEPRTAALEQLDRPAVRAARRAGDAVVEQLEQAIILVEAMVARLALEDMAALADEIKASQARLREMMQAYRKDPNDALKARIMRDIQRLRDRMAEMRSRMTQMRQKLPEEFLNIDGLKQGELADGLEQTQEQLGDLEKMLEEGRIDDALAALDEMTQAMDQFSAALDQDMQDLHDETNPAMQRTISELMDQTRDLMKRQAELMEKTEALAQQEAEAQRQALEEEFGDKLKAIIEEAGALRRTVDRLARQPLSTHGEDELDHLKQRVDELQRALGQRQLMEALEMSNRSMDHLDAMGALSVYELDAERTGALVELGRRQDSRIMRELADLIESARRRTEQAITPDEAGELVREQQALREAAERLRRRIAESDGAPPDQGGQEERQADQGNRRKAEQERAGQMERERADRGAGGEQTEAEREQAPGNREGQQAGRPMPMSAENAQPQPGQGDQQEPGGAPRPSAGGDRQMIPGLQSLPEGARRAGEAMNQAAEQLRRRRPSQARPGQEEAQSQLQSLMEGLRRAAQPQRVDRSQGRRPDSERVRIPGAEEYQAPAEFREELLDAMKERPPEAWQEQVKRYYESLIQ